MSRKLLNKDALSEENLDSPSGVRRSSRISSSQTTLKNGTRNSSADSTSPPIEKRKTRRASTDEETKPTSIKTRRSSVSKIIEEEKLATPGSPTRKSTRSITNSPMPGRRITRSNSASLETEEVKELPARRSTRRRSSVDTEDGNVENIETSKPLTRRRRSSSLDEVEEKTDIKSRSRKLYSEDNQLEPIEEQEVEAKDTEKSLVVSNTKDDKHNILEDHEEETKKIINDIDQILSPKQNSKPSEKFSPRSIFSPITPQGKTTQEKQIHTTGDLACTMSEAVLKDKDNLEEFPSSEKNKPEESIVKQELVSKEKTIETGVGLNESFNLSSSKKTPVKETSKKDNDEVFYSPGSDKENHSINTSVKPSPKKDILTPKLSSKTINSDDFYEPMEVDDDDEDIFEKSTVSSKSNDFEAQENLECNIQNQSRSSDSNQGLITNQKLDIIENENIENSITSPKVNIDKNEMTVDEKSNISFTNVEHNQSYTNEGNASSNVGKTFDHINSSQSDKEHQDSLTENVNNLKSEVTYIDLDTDNSSEISIKLIDSDEENNDKEHVKETEQINPVKESLVGRSKRRRISDGNSKQILSKLKDIENENDIEHQEKSERNEIEGQLKPITESVEESDSSQNRSCVDEVEKQIETCSAVKSSVDNQKKDIDFPEIPTEREINHSKSLVNDVDELSKTPTKEKLSEHSTSNTFDIMIETEENKEVEKECKKMNEENTLEIENISKVEKEKTTDKADVQQAKEEKINNFETRLESKETKHQQKESSNKKRLSASKENNEELDTGINKSNLLDSKLKKIEECGINILSPSKNIKILSNEQIEPSDDDSSDDNSHPVLQFLDDEAEEREKDTSCSENEEDNHGITLHSDDTEYSAEESDHSENSFIVDDEEYELLSGNEYDIEINEKKTKRKRSRIIVPDSSSDTDNEKNPPLSKKNDIPEILISGDKINLDLITKTTPSKSGITKSGKSDNEEPSANQKNIHKRISKSPKAQEVEKVKTPSKKTNIVEDSPKLKPSATILNHSYLHNNSSTPNSSFSDINLSKNHSNARVSSIIIHENISATEAKSDQLIAKVDKMVKAFCANIDNDGNVSMNVSLEYTESPNPTSLQLSSTDIKNEKLLESFSNKNTPKQHNTSPKKRKISNIVLNESPNKIENQLNQSVKDDVTERKKPKISFSAVKENSEKELLETHDENKLEKNRNIPINENHGIKNKSKSPNFGGKNDKSGLDKSLTKNQIFKIESNEDIENPIQKKDKNQMKPKKAYSSKEKKQKLLEMACKELTDDDLRHILPSRNEHSFNSNSKTNKKRLKRLNSEINKNKKIFTNLVTDIKNRPKRLVLPSTSVENSDWIVNEDNVMPSIGNSSNCNFNREKFDPKDFKNRMLYDSKIKREPTTTFLRKKGRM